MRDTCEAADEIRMNMFFQTVRSTEPCQVAVTSNILTDNFVGLVTSGQGPDMASGPPGV
jgi:hypothetical protein